ncbi:head-tail connector protein [Mangrovibacter plantisponsor]|uniref:Gp6-like head-tail connector protein n=1 Tax=Mangrovibacter plantisponsor TaxID=451513 RepID=A0A317PGG4_9ENTR|nr:head-tail connector protein [Mangrovibacter plantisponsor]PWV99412.1 gp6-like head-tail connector protein [Mangrovibacter plantisponsor]
MILTLEEIRQQLRLESDYTEEDTLLTMLGQAAESRTATFLNRNLYAAEADIPEGGDETALVVPDDLRLAMLMLVTHFYEHRSTVSDFEQSETPMAYQWIAGPYRFIPL